MIGARDILTLLCKLCSGANFSLFWLCKGGEVVRCGSCGADCIIKIPELACMASELQHCLRFDELQ